jgi:hypothetical protein
MVIFPFGFLQLPYTFHAESFCFACFVQMFGMSKVVAERSAAGAKEAEVESALPLQTSVSQ